MIEGISLGTLMPGLTYDLPHELALRLITERVAREDLTPVVLIPIGYDENDAELVDHVTRGIRVTRALSEATEEPGPRPSKNETPSLPLSAHSLSRENLVRALIPPT